MINDLGLGLLYRGYFKKFPNVAGINSGSIITADKLIRGCQSEGIFRYMGNASVIANNSRECTVNQDPPCMFGETSGLIFMGEKESVSILGSSKLLCRNQEIDFRYKKLFD